MAAVAAATAAAAAATSAATATTATTAAVAAVVNYNSTADVSIGAGTVPVTDDTAVDAGTTATVTWLVLSGSLCMEGQNILDPSKFEWCYVL